MNSDYQLHPDGRFVIRNYNEKKPFSNFLPGIAGLYGTPMWVFYVNRGQGISSFGTKNKDNAILEFFPANKAYQTVTSLGFRTFIKGLPAGRQASARGREFHYEPFKPSASDASAIPEQVMGISSHELVIRETHKSLGLEIELRYFTVPGEPLAVLARELSIQNISHEALDCEILDGLPAVNPYGMNEYFVKNMSRTIEAWMVTENLTGKKAPFFRLKVDASDRPEVISIREGNFYFGAEPIVDASKIFGSQLDFSEPRIFYQNTPFRVPKDQIVESRTPCAFGFAEFALKAGETKKIRSFFGQSKTVELLNRFVSRTKSAGYFEAKALENKKLIESIKGRMFTASAHPEYDLYCGQTYLDNVIRGGLPVYLGARQKGFIHYVYSRKHGDLERDYNRFVVEPAYFSQGDGNYRDVNQNRRCDPWFEPRVGDANIKTFLDLVQLDGFNPLVVKGTLFHFKASRSSRKVLGGFFVQKHAKEVEHWLLGSFGLGAFYRFLEEKGWISEARFRQLLAELSPFIVREEQAEHGEGFWTDHWTYNLDLIENYLAIFPENHRKTLFEDENTVFYDTDHRVRPRNEKYFLEEGRGVRQYRALEKDKEKAALLAERKKEAAWVRTRHGRGGIYHTTLFVKLLCLFTNKFASLDASGIGVEMEADKPSWCDSLNGLPGLLGSSLPETFELKRLALFLIGSIEDLEMDLRDSTLLPGELFEFIRKMETALRKHFSARSGNGKEEAKDFEFWEAASSAKEAYRAATHWGLSGREKRLALSAVKSYLEHAREKIEMGLGKAYDEKIKMFPTYFENSVTRYHVSGKGPRLHVKPLEFKQSPLPIFLESAVHALKVEKDPSRRRELLKAVRQSELYDSKLKMYKVCASLSKASWELGRACVFAPGWLENESIWLHMEYKFLLEILKSGLTDEFFKDFRNQLIPFQDPERYGRSILENSSFIVSSAFLDASLHGTGFVARLSGSTAEFLNMWLLMNVGKRPFILGPDQKLSLRFDPQLPADFFVKEDVRRTYVSPEGEETEVKIPKNGLAFIFLGKTLVTYHNPKRLDTFGKQRVAVKKISLELAKGRRVDGSTLLTIDPERSRRIEFKGAAVPSPYAARVRDEFVPKIDIELG